MRRLVPVRRGLGVIWLVVADHSPEMLMNAGFDADEVSEPVLFVSQSMPQSPTHGSDLRFAGLIV